MHLWLLCRMLAIGSMLLMGSVAFSNKADAGSLRLTWKDTSTNESGFKVERQAGSSFTEIAKVGTNATSYTDSGLADGTIYCYRVRAFNSAGASSPSNQACANATNPEGNVSVGESTSGTSGDSTSSTGSGSGSSSASYMSSSWSDYRITIKTRSSDNDAMGVMFRYQDSDNYYRFSWYAQEKSRRLEKRVDGIFKVLAQDTVPYTTGQTYKLQIIAQGSSLKVLIDGRTIFSVIDTSIAKGTIALYAHYNAGSSFDDVLVENLATGSVLLSENFNDGTLGWTFIDETNEDGPARWVVSNGVLVQTSNAGSTGPNDFGTYALYTPESWKDYRVTLKTRSRDNDAMGVMFRYQDSDNYYRFSWYAQEKSRRLEKRVGGTFKMLAQDTVPYTTGQTYKLQIIAQGSSLKVLIDGRTIFSVTDTSLADGSIALYSHYNAGSSFDDVLVEDLATGSVLLSDNFNDGSTRGWTFIDEGNEDGPSRWWVSNGILVQSSNIGSTTLNDLGTYALYTLGN
ncbi:MAG: family 16 glycoside hydrolase [Candidatus Binatia bacterium]